MAQQAQLGLAQRLGSFRAARQLTGVVAHPRTRRRIVSAASTPH
jgi:hypothetical protein